MTPEESDAAVEQIAHIREEFERAENAGDASVVDEYCAEDVVVIPPGRPPAVGRDAARESLEELFAAYDIEVDYTSEEVVVDEDLAFDRLKGVEILVPKSGGDRAEHWVNSLWVYRRTDDGEWKQIRIIWNYTD